MKKVLLSLSLLVGGLAAQAQTAYVACLDSVRVLDMTTHAQIATIGVGVNPAGVSASMDGQYVYVANYGDSTVSVISTASQSGSAKASLLNSAMYSPLAIAMPWFTAWEKPVFPAFSIKV